MDADVIIVGAGACGLMAAKELSRAGKKILILEARDRLGGRIVPLSEEAFGYPAQGGAEFVHGEAPVTRTLVDEAGLTLEHPIPWWEVPDTQKKVDVDPATLERDPLQEKLDQLQRDETVREFMEREFPGEENAALREMTYRRIQGYDAADPDKMSAFALRDELENSNGWVQKNLIEGYGALVKFLERKSREHGVEIRLNNRVVRIEHAAGGVRVFCEDGSTCEAQRVVVTVPLPVISDIEFSPAIPEKFEAVSRIGFGPVIKVLIRFKEKWWSGVRERHFERSFFLFSGEKIPTWWTQYPQTQTTLTGWLAGPKAHALAVHSDEELFELALASLSNIFKITPEELRAEILVSKVMNWEKDPFVRGAYSYPTPQTEEALKILGEPVDGTLFFAGEVFGGGASATVEGALASGLAVARKLLTR